jgi:hypothetical protein
VREGSVELGIQPDYMNLLKLDEEECKRRLDFFELTDEDFAAAGSNRLFKCCTNEITEASAN